MEPTFLTAIHIHKVRHLTDIDIPLSSDVRKNLILTGKNGSGKTSVLDALSGNIMDPGTDFTQSIAPTEAPVVGSMVSPYVGPISVF